MTPLKSVLAVLAVIAATMSSLALAGHRDARVWNAAEADGAYVVVPRSPGDVVGYVSAPPVYYYEPAAPRYYYYEPRPRYYYYEPAPAYYYYYDTSPFPDDRSLD